MHAFLVVGKTHEARIARVKELLKKYKSGQVETLTPGKLAHSINSIRELIHTLALHSVDVRGVVIQQADKLTTEAANAFLKTLEEPPANTIIILTAPNRESVIETIASRCFMENIGSLGVELTDQQKEGAEKLFQKLSENGVGERFKFVDAVKDREEAVKFVVGQIWAAREAMLTNINEQRVTSCKLPELLHRLLQTQKDLEANVNTKLVLTELMLQY